MSLFYSLQAGELDGSSGREFSLASMDTNTLETQNLYNKTSSNNGFFGLESYRKIYFMPISYNKDKPPRLSSTLPPGQNVPFEDSEYEKNTEVIFQFSLKLQLLYDVLGLNEFIYVGYTQKSFWQAHAKSGPMRETNYEPELYMDVPASNNFENGMGLKALRFGFVHESNGEDGYTSRSWNRIYLTGVWQWENLFAQTRVWYRIPEDDKPEGYFNGTLLPHNPNADGDENPNIEEYLGYGDIRLNYLYKKSQIDILFRNNLRFSENKGAIELSYMHPISDSEKVFWYAEFFNGYGDSLIDYNREVTRISVGFSFSRGLF